MKCNCNTNIVLDFPCLKTSGSYEVHTFLTKPHSLGKGFTLASSLEHYIENKSLFISKLERYKKNGSIYFCKMQINVHLSILIQFFLSPSLPPSVCLSAPPPRPFSFSLIILMGPGLHLTLTHALNYRGPNWPVSDRKCYNPSFVPAMPMIISIIY